LKGTVDVSKFANQCRRRLEAENALG